MDAGRKRELEEKVYAGCRLDRADGVELYESDDLAWLGRLAHHRRADRNGDRVTFTVGRHLDLTAGGVTCAYCSSDRAVGDPLTVEEAVRAAVAMADGQRLAELQLVGARHPALPWRYFPELLRALRAALPGVHLSGFTAADVRWLADIARCPADAVLDELIDAGLESLSGGGTAIFDPEVRHRLAEDDRHWEEWSGIHRLAQARGMRTPSTMLYGHVEEPRHRVDHVLRLRELQDETGGVASFAPVRCLHDLAGAAGTASPADSLRTFAVSRLLFDNVPQVACRWATHGASMAQLSLHFGADDLDGSAAECALAPEAGLGAGPGGPHRDELLHLIWDAGFRPVERDVRHGLVREYDPPPSLAQRRSEPQQVWA